MLQTGDIIKNLRIKNNYTQNELAIMLGLQLSTLQKYENGSIVNLKLETLRELCHIFEVPPHLLVMPNATKKELKEMNLWCLREYYNLNDAGIKKVMDYLNDICKINDYKL